MTLIPDLFAWIWGNYALSALRTLQRAWRKVAISTTLFFFCSPQIKSIPHIVSNNWLTHRQACMCHSPAGLRYAAWGWTCKDSGHCNTDFKNQSGICKRYMDRFPKPSHHAVAQIELIGLMNELLGAVLQFVLLTKPD